MIAVLVFVAAATIDFASVRRQAEVAAAAPTRAALWSVAQFAAGAVGLVAAVRVGWWLLAPEGLGYFAGTWLAVRRLREPPDMARLVHDPSPPLRRGDAGARHAPP